MHKSAGTVLYAGKSFTNVVTRFQLLGRTCNFFTTPCQSKPPSHTAASQAVRFPLYLPSPHSPRSTAPTNLVETDIHSGNPLGSISIQHDLRTYVSLPSSAHKGGAEGQVGQKQDTIILISDIFGIDLVNSKLIADEWAGQGYKVLLPDFFEGDPIPESLLQVNILLFYPLVTCCL